MTGRSVVQGWVSDLSMKEQTVLLLETRGSDLNNNEDVKKMSRWIRSIILKNADKDDGFMKDIQFRDLLDIYKADKQAVDSLPLHFFTHLMHAFEIIGYSHPNIPTQCHAEHQYLQFCEYLHVQPEGKYEMRQRLADKNKEITGDL